MELIKCQTFPRRCQSERGSWTYWTYTYNCKAPPCS